MGLFRKRRTNDESQDSGELADAERLDKALAHLEKQKFDRAEAVLRDVCSRCPEDYEYEFVRGDERFVRAWDFEEFLACTQSDSGNDQMTTHWVVSVYPRACYQLGFLLVEKGDYEGAVRWLERGSRLEPQRPEFLLECGNAYGHMGDHARALECFEHAATLPRLSSVQKAAALRCMGIQLIDLGRLDEAQERLGESLRAEPDDPLTVEKAMSELQYIAMLRAQGEPA